MASRAKNTASVEEYCRVMRGSIRKWDPALFTGVSWEQTVSNFEDFLLDLLRATPRPTKVLLASAATEVFGASQEDGGAFAERMG